jgi:acyl-CoA reductase-like NAD-dependent aldehyde dehydrogenase
MAEVDWDRLTEAQQQWSLRPTADRAKPLKQFATLLERHADELFDRLDDRNQRNIAQFISSELLPLAIAAKWLSKNARRILKPRTIRHRGLNAFLGRMKAIVTREPFGKVFIIGTWNYPVFLTGVQVIQGLVAGNAVIIKPAPGCEHITQRFVDLLIEAGYPSVLLEVVSSDADGLDRWLQFGIDMIVMTASSKTGRIIAAKAAQKLVPVIAELSGCDAMFVLDDADLDRVADAVAFGLRLNGSATCMAPRRLLISDRQADQLIPMLIDRCDSIPSAKLSDSTNQYLQDLIQNATSNGARLATPLDSAKPAIVDHVAPNMRIANADIFAPVVSIIRCNADDFVAINQRCAYALSASIFGGVEQATRLANRVNAGVVTINDLFAPTIEPSLSFGGRNESGFGLTRGEEGLRQLTREKSITIRYGNFLPHLQPPNSSDEGLIRGLFRWSCAPSLSTRFAGLRTMIHAIRNRSRND